MNIVFYYISEIKPLYAKYCIGSIKKYMPTANIIQLTDMKTSAICGAEVVRKETKTRQSISTVNHIGYEFLSQMNFRKVVFIDPDMMFNGSIDHLMNSKYDVTVATRMLKDHIGISYRKMFPYNSFMVVNNPEFWGDCYSELKKYKKIRWLNNMSAVAKVISSGKYKIKLLDGDIYNNTPKNENNYDKNVKIFHFKGDKKTYMKPFFEKYINAS